MSFGKKVLVLTLVAVVISSLTTEVDARRKILRGRKTITRTYYRGLEIPGWIITLLYAIGIVVINCVIFFSLNKWVVMRNEPQPAVQYRMEHEV